MDLTTEYEQSLAPEIIGFSLEKLHSLLGSKDVAMFERIYREMDSDNDDLPPQFLDQARAILKTAIDCGVPFPDLASESEAHVFVAASLATYDQEITQTKPQWWEVAALWSLADQFKQDLEEEPRKLIHYLCEGRPLFGRVIETERSYYGYLTQSEAALLANELSQLEEHIKDWEDAGTVEFVRELIACLESVQEAEQDLWFQLF